jgi:3'(2'), 5'-bisphosphate nucleotidase
MIKDIIEIAKSAGDTILEIYKDADLSNIVDYKGDDSPLTLADNASNDVIVKALKIQFPDIPVMSEEMAQAPYETRKNWTKFFCVDPLDGTKEFIKKNGEFTVNIALIENDLPVLGVIYVPVTDVTYAGSSEGAIKIEGDKELKIEINNKASERIAVRSKSHAAVEEEVLLEKYNVTDTISVGSSLKFCMVAEGKADIYYRHGPTMEWDTAAGQAVVQAAGGKVYQGDKEDDLFTYNKKNLLNGSFLVLGF